MSLQREKGTRWETEVVRYLNSRGYSQAERRALHGVYDKGDVSGVFVGEQLPVVFECKNEQNVSLAGYMKELEAELLNANAPFGAAIVKRRNKGVSEAYAVMPFSRFVDLLDGVK